MSRIVKFKAWDNINHCWLDLWKILFSSSGEVMAVQTLDGEQYGLHQVTPVQYTGLKDKHGKEVYEGDIASVPYVNPIGHLDMTTESRKATVIFEDGGFKLTDYGDYQDISYWQERGQTKYVPNHGNVTELLPHTKLTIIGNIHANPDLLKS
jgi:uncharacterized phage protein (TIGR01671 family)